MKYYKDFIIQYQDVDADRKVRLYTLENYLLNVGGNVADELGFGLKDLWPEGLTWVLTRLSMEMAYLPANCEKIVIETWIESNAHMLSTRDYRIWLVPADSEGPYDSDVLAQVGARLIGKVKSVWAVLDATKREIVNCFDRPVFRDNVDGTVLDMARAQRFTLITEPEAVSTHIVQYSDVDYNRHCNSCHYLEIMQNTKLLDLQGGGVRLDISYSKEVYLGEALDTLYVTDENGIQYAQKDKNGSTCCIARLTRINGLSGVD